MTVGESYSTIKSLNHFSNANFKPILIALSSAAKIGPELFNPNEQHYTTLHHATSNKSNHQNIIKNNYQRQLTI